MRVYLAATLPTLATAWKQGRFVAPGSAHAVTPTLRESYASGDQEELEYVAMSEAARASLALLVQDPDASPRRAVVAVDVPDHAVRLAPERGRSAVDVQAEPRLDQVAAVHVDEAEAEDVLRTAIAALPAAQAGDGDAEFAVSEAEGFELLWYARQEIPDLVS